MAIHGAFVPPRPRGRLPENVVNHRPSPIQHVLLMPVAPCLCASAAASELHRATRPGNPATRFADPLHSPDDLRRTLSSEALRQDVNTILRQSGYLCHFDDFLAAVATAEIRAISIPVGTVLPAMSTRRRGVLWAGKELVDAYEFSFISGDRRYRVVTPKACSNFGVEEQLPRPAPVLELSCTAPANVALGRPLTVCPQRANTGDLAERQVDLRMRVPAELAVEHVSVAAGARDGADLVWRFAPLAPGERREACVTHTPTRAGALHFAAIGSGERGAAATAHCAVDVHGVPAVLLHVIDIGDPVEVGKDVVYEIAVFNQGSTALTQVAIVATLKPQQRYVEGGGDSPLHAEGQRVIAQPRPELLPRTRAPWRMVVKAVEAGDVRFGIDLTADQFARPV